MSKFNKIGLGGGCHWCTEGIFNSLKGVEKVEQGWIASDYENSSLSEGIIVHYNPSIISLKELLKVHIYTHSSTSNHTMRVKYRSAIYVFSKRQLLQSEKLLSALQREISKPLITKVLMFSSFKLNEETYLNYFYKQPQNSFCTTYIHPKIKLLIDQFTPLTDFKKMAELNLNNI